MIFGHQQNQKPPLTASWIQPDESPVSSNTYNKHPCVDKHLCVQEHAVTGACCLICGGDNWM